MNVFTSKNSEQLLSYFGKDTRENRKEETFREIEEAFSFLDGDISSCNYDARHGNIRQMHRDFHVYFWNGYVFFQIATTNEKNYTVILDYIRIWEEHPEYEGIEGITIWSEEKEEVTIGTWHASLYPEDEGHYRDQGSQKCKKEKQGCGVRRHRVLVFSCTECDAVYWHWERAEGAEPLREMSIRNGHCALVSLEGMEEKEQK